MLSAALSKNYKCSSYKHFFYKLLKYMSNAVKIVLCERKINGNILFKIKPTDTIIL